MIIIYKKGVSIIIYQLKYQKQGEYNIFMNLKLYPNMDLSKVSYYIEYEIKKIFEKKVNSGAKIKIKKMNNFLNKENPSQNLIKDITNVKFEKNIKIFNNFQ